MNEDVPKIVDNFPMISFSPQPNSLSSSREPTQTPRQSFSITPRNEEVSQSRPKSSIEIERIQTPRPATPVRKPKVINRFLDEAQRWSQRSEDMHYSILLSASKEVANENSTRRTVNNVRKIADLDEKFLKRIIAGRSQDQVRYQTTILFKNWFSKQTLCYTCLDQTYFTRTNPQSVFFIFSWYDSDEFNTSDYETM